MEKQSENMNPGKKSFNVLTIIWLLIYPVRTYVIIIIII